MPETDAMPTDLSTPILDSGVLPPRIQRKRSRSQTKAILVLVAAVVVMLPVIAWVDKSRDPKTGFFLLVSALAAVVIIHEVGHLLAGWTVGFRFGLLHIGPLSLNLEHGKLKVRVRREMLAMSGVGMHVRTVRRLRRRLLIHAAGGPAANVLSVPTAILLSRLLPVAEGTWLGALLDQIAVFSLLSAVVNLVPIRSPFLSDGARIEMLLRSRDRGRRWLSIAALTNLHDRGIRARDWKRTWVRSASGFGDGSLDAFIGYWLAYMSASDRKDGHTSTVHLERCLELAGTLPPSTRDILAQEAVVFAAWFRDDASLADQWLTQVKRRRRLQPLVRLRLDVALRCAHRDYTAADSSWQEGRTFIEKATTGPAQEQLRLSWLEWQEEIEDRKAQQLTTANNAD